MCRREKDGFAGKEIDRCASDCDRFLFFVKQNKKNDAAAKFLFLFQPAGDQSERNFGEKIPGTVGTSGWRETIEEVFGRDDSWPSNVDFKSFWSKDGQRRVEGRAVGRPLLPLLSLPPLLRAHQRASQGQKFVKSFSLKAGIRSLDTPLCLFSLGLWSDDSWYFFSFFLLLENVRLDLLKAT